MKTFPDLCSFQICKRIDRLNQSLLNRGFVYMTRRHANNLKNIKSQLPRRESERRNHPLAKHSDILTCIETRLSMLSMTYTKYMDLGLCCFIPGKVIDEVLNILKIVETTTKPLRAHEVLQELRDISSMATDHFDDEIAPILKQRYVAEQQHPHPGPSASSSPREHTYSYHLDRSLSEKLVCLPDTSLNSSTMSSSSRCDGSHGCPLAQLNRTLVQKLENSYKQALRKARAMVQIQSKQMLQMKNYTVEMSQLKSQITDLKKRLEEYEVKNREMAATITQMKSSQDGASTSGYAAVAAAGADSGLSNTSSPTRNIKPRAATIILKRRIDESPISPTLSPVESILKKRRSDD